MCIIKHNSRDKHETRSIKMFRIETRGSNEKTVVTLVSLRILLEHTSTEE
jgi:hypothetical protein